MDRAGPVRYRVGAVTCARRFINYVDRGNLATAAPLVQDELHLTNAQVGLLLSAFFWSYAPAQLLSGWLAHRFDVRYVLAAGLAVWSAATALTGLTAGFLLLPGTRTALGDSVQVAAVGAPVSYLRILRRGEAWGTGIGCFLSFYGYYFVLTWLPLYLVKARGLSQEDGPDSGGLSARDIPARSPTKSASQGFTLKVLVTARV